MTDRDADAITVVTGALDLAAALQSGIDIVLAAEQLTAPQANALWVLDPSRGPRSRKAVAAQLRCDPSNVTLIADRLVALGLLRRVHDPQDRRVKALVLTVRGVRARARILHALAAGPPLDRLTAEDLGRLAQLLQRATGASVNGPITPHEPPAVDDVPGAEPGRAPLQASPTPSAVLVPTDPATARPTSRAEE